jgi:hypothetical protein
LEELIMSIQDFHSKLVAGNEQNRLLEALRRLMSLENLEASATEGWVLWTDESIVPPPALATAKA